MRASFRLYGVMWASTLLLCAATTALSFDFKESENKVQMTTLKNGLRVICVSRDDAPVASMITYANVGSSDDPKGFTGMAHVFEHMAFKGDNQIGTNDFTRESKAIESEEAAFLAWRSERSKGAGQDSTKLTQLEKAFRDAQGRCDSFVVTNELPNIMTREGFVATNAFTSIDQTCYIYNFPQNKLELAIMVEGSRFANTVLREYHKEVDVVKEERRMRIESNPIGRLLEEFLGSAYKAHPYGISGLGHMSDLGNYSRAEAMQFFRKYYVPNNMCLAVVGDVNPQDVFRYAEKYFGGLLRGPDVDLIQTIEPKQNGERRVAIEDPSQAVLLVGFHSPNWTHPDKYALDALVDHLGNGRTSLLYEKLVKETKQAAQVGALTGLPGDKYPSMVCMYAFASKGVTAATLEKQFDEEIERLKVQTVTPDELAAIKARAKDAFINEFGDRQNLALQLAKYEMIGGGWRNFYLQLDRINAVTAEDIQRVAKEYFTRSNRTVAFIETTES